MIDESSDEYIRVTWLYKLSNFIRNRAPTFLNRKSVILVVFLLLFCVFFLGFVCFVLKAVTFNSSKKWFYIDDHWPSYQEKQHTLYPGDMVRLIMINKRILRCKIESFDNNTSFTFEIVNCSNKTNLIRKASVDLNEYNNYKYQLIVRDCLDEIAKDGIYQPNSYIDITNDNKQFKNIYLTYVWEFVGDNSTIS